MFCFVRERVGSIESTSTIERVREKETFVVKIRTNMYDAGNESLINIVLVRHEKTIMIPNVSRGARVQYDRHTISKRDIVVGGARGRGGHDIEQSTQSRVLLRDDGILFTLSPQHDHRRHWTRGSVRGNGTNIQTRRVSGYAKDETEKAAIIDRAW